MPRDRLGSAIGMFDSSGGWVGGYGDTGKPAGTTTYTYNAALQLTGTSADTTTWTYDAAGNQTRNGITGQTMAYDDRLAVTNIGSTAYTAFGQGNQQQLTRSDGT